MNPTAKKWFRVFRDGRRTAAAAAAMTLAAGMVAAPATAAVPDASSESQPQAGTRQEGVQVAQAESFGRPAMRPGPGPVPPEQQSPYGNGPARPGRVRAPEVGPPPPEGLIELTPGAEALLQAAKDVSDYQDFTQEQKDAAIALAKLRQEVADRPIAQSFPEAESIESDHPMRNEGPSLLSRDERQAIGAQLAKEGLTEPLGYLNPYQTWQALGPAKQADLRLAGDRQWLGDQLLSSKLPADVRDQYKDALTDILGRISRAETPEQREALIDQFNAAKDDFNRAEMNYRDDNNLYDNDDRQVPRALDPGLPEAAPDSLRAAKAAMEQQEALDAAREQALEPGVMTGGDVNDATQGTDPGPVGGDPAKAARDQSLQPGVMTGGDVNDATQGTDPGPVGGDPAKAAREQSLQPGVMTGGDVNDGSQGTDPGPVGGNGQDDPGKATTGAVDQGRVTDTDNTEASGTASDPDADNSGQGQQSAPSADSQTTAGRSTDSSESSDSTSAGGTDSTGGSSSFGGGSTSSGGDSAGDGGSSSSGGDGGSSGGGE